MLLRFEHDDCPVAETVIAKKIIEIAGTDHRGGSVLCERALHELGLTADY